MTHAPDPADPSHCLCGEFITFFLPNGVRLCGTGFELSQATCHDQSATKNTTSMRFRNQKET